MAVGIELSSALAERFNDYCNPAPKMDGREEAPMERLALKRLWVSIGLMLPVIAVAAPSGGVIEAGEATISQGGNNTQVDQASQTAVIGWDQFNVGADESVTFAVPGASSVTLNKIYDQLPSQILGHVTSNGRVILANPNGLFFGADSQLNVGSLVGTTSEVSLSGDRLTLHGAPEGSGIDQRGDVISSGTVAYYAPHIDLSGSVISGGDIRVSTHTQGVITLTDSGIGFDVSDSDEQALIQKGINVSGTLRSDGGYVGLETAAVDSLYNSALNMEGVVSADSLVSAGGRIELSATQGVTEVTGDISASSATGVGGEIRIAGQGVALAGEGSLSADGALGGGTVYYGGGWDYTSGPDIARRAYLGIDTQVTADATQNGDGGEIWIWSEEQSVVQGGLSTRGVGQDGNGGFVETSSLGQIVVETSPDVGSDSGKGGKWLLDPQVLYIVEFLTSFDPTSPCLAQRCSNVDYSSGPPIALTPDASDTSSTVYSYVNSGYLTLLLEAGNDVTLKTTGSDSGSYILQNPNALLDFGPTATGTLTLETSGTIYLYNDIIADSPDFTLILKADGSIYPTNNSSEITVGTLELQSPSFYQGRPLSISADSVIVQDGMIWNTANNPLTFSDDTDLSSSQSDGSMEFTGLSISNALTLGSVGQLGNRFGAIGFRGNNSNFVLKGTDFSAKSINFYGFNNTVTSDADLMVLVDQLTTNSSLDWVANGNLSIIDGNLTSVIQNNYTLEIDMKNNNLTFDNVAGTSGIRSLDLNNVGELTINGVQIDQRELSIDAARVRSISALEIDVTNVELSDNLEWTAEADLTFTSQSSLNSMSTSGDVTFNLDGNNLAFGSVGLGVNGIGEFSLNDVDILTLTDSILISDSSLLDLGPSRVSGIELNGNASLTTQDGAITLASVTAGANDPGTEKAPTLSLTSGSGTINLQSMAGIGNIALNSTGDITANGNITSVGGNIVLDAGQFYVNNVNGPVVLTAGADIDLNAPVDSAIGATSDLTLQAGRVDVGNVGVTNAIGNLQLLSSGTVALNGDTLKVGELSVDAANLNLTSDTVMTVSGSNANFNTTDITGSGLALSILANNADVELDGVVGGSLTVDASEMTLSDTIVTSGAAGINFSQVDVMALAADTLLNAGVQGDILLPNDIAGAFDLSLFVSEGDLVMGSQNSETPLGSLTLVDSAPLFGTNSTTDGITVTNQLNLSDVGSLAVSNNAEFVSEAGDVLLAGTSLLATGQSVTVSAMNDVSLSSVEANRFVLSSVNTVLDGDITALTQLDLSKAGTIQLADDVTLTGPLQLSSGGVSTSVNGNYSLTIDASGKNLTLFDMGNAIALNSLEVMNAATLQLAGGVTTQGTDGISFSGARLDLTADTDLNTSSSNGLIDLSGIGVNGEFTLILNAGNGNVALGSIGQDQALVSLVLEDATQLSLSSDISTADTLLELSNAESIVLVDNVSIDTTAGDGTIDFGSTAIDGTFALSLSTGTGNVQLADVGQSVALQSLHVTSEADMNLTRDISVIDKLSLTANSFTIDNDLNSFGGRVDLNSAAGIFISKVGLVQAYDDISMTADTGNINLGKAVSDTGRIDVVAQAGSILNTLGDFVSVKETSVNLTASNVSLVAGLKIGQDSANPIVLDVPQRGLIDLTLTAPTAYIVNINQAKVTSNGQVFDVLSASQSSAQSAYSNSNLQNDVDVWMTRMNTPEPDSELFAIAQPGYVLATNETLNNNQISSDIPAVPNIRQQQDEWWLLYTRQPQP